MLPIVFASLLTGSTLFSEQHLLSLAEFASSQPKQQIATLMAMMSNQPQTETAAIEQYLTLALDVKDRDVRSAALSIIGLRASAWRARQLNSPRNDAIAAILRRGANASGFPGAAASPLTAEDGAMLSRLEGPVRQLTSDPDSRVRAAALRALSVLMVSRGAPPEESSQIAIGVFEKEQPQEVRLAALDAIREVRSTQVTAFLIDRLIDPAPSIRARALDILGSQQTASVIPRILEILATDPDWFPRWYAAHALTMMWPYSRHALAHVEARESQEADSRVREEIGRTLLNLRRRLPNEHARVVDAAYPELIGRVRTGTKLSESPRSISLPIDPSSNLAVVPRTDRDVIAAAVCLSDLVVIGRINPVGILLDTDETFLFSHNTVVIDEILHGQGARAGAQLLYVRPGGSMRLKGQEVRTEHVGYASGWIYNRRQIMFLKRVAGFDAVKAVLPIDILFLDAGTVLAFQTEGDGALSGPLTEADVVSWIRGARCGAK